MNDLRERIKNLLRDDDLDAFETLVAIEREVFTGPIDATPQSEGLDAAWAKAEALYEAMGPEAGTSALILAKYPGRHPEIAYEANAFVTRDGAVASGPTPAAALLALAAALTEQEDPR